MNASFEAENQEVLLKGSLVSEAKKEIRVFKRN